MADDEVEKLIGTYEKYAKSAGIRLNPDRTIVENICKGLLGNQAKHGARYCPCRLVSGDKDKDKGNICPCIYHKDEIKRDGHCHCNLFVS
jgi:ferredoxin-thioredoxin reductase catalytic chain